MDSTLHTIYPLGDRGLTIELGREINAATNVSVMRLFHQLRNHPIPFVEDIIPAYSSVTLIYDTVAIRKAFPQQTAFDWMKAKLSREMNAIDQRSFTGRLMQIPVCYDLAFGPDLPLIADHANISVEEVIRIHTATRYTVYMIGFLPGFPYMASVDPKIQVPRKTQPRLTVPAGSVGIAGEQTGIYPLDSPGGWQLIGRTPLLLFDVSLETPCLLQPGDEVQFYAIPLIEFNQLNHQPAHEHFHH